MSHVADVAVKCSQLMVDQVTISVTLLNLSFCSVVHIKQIFIACAFTGNLYS